MLFVFEHLMLSSGRLCLKRLNENFVSLSLEGTCDVFLESISQVFQLLWRRN